RPKVRVSPVQSGSLPQIDRLVCHVSGLYPTGTGDWTYQVLVRLEPSPQRGDSYLCQVEHGSLQQPLSQRWEMPSDS
ncbi:PREDICTED: class II histocompatibility antigen, B-L beta chain-like, partial [Buceros rhinoceros silvestris]|uniref:class II histocompatibility antigen, B-L beta chain-like n=1 Tax=Buceros rhinoceros silvestris TaxID=175836 RepID=UPI000528F149